MNRRIISILLVFLAIAGILAGCTADASDQSIFSVPEESHKSEKSAVYNEFDYYNSIFLGMSLTEYKENATSKLGEEGIECFTSLSYDKEGNVVEGKEWEAVYSYFYNEDMDMNTVVRADFLDGKLHYMDSVSVCYAEDYDDFLFRAEYFEGTVEDLGAKFGTRNEDVMDKGREFSVWWNNDSAKNTESYDDLGVRFIYIPNYLKASDSVPSVKGSDIDFDIEPYSEESSMMISMRMGTYDYFDSSEYLPDNVDKSDATLGGFISGFGSEVYGDPKYENAPEWPAFIK